MVENPKGNDGQERRAVRNNAVKSKAEMEHRFKTAKKYRDDPEVQALFSTPKQEKKADVKKSKG